ncbi:MAG: phospholipid carrier-dependent glycosyltransferase [candidate division Zixibacteria bacterium]|nr:phospholipid carrier-dependent glycosyltransferase [candidate division Zixibacteria bacterium]
MPASFKSWFKHNDLLLVLALSKLLIHLLISNNFGYFADELYYKVASERLAFGYIDFQPLIAFIIKAAVFIFGDSVSGLRVLAAVAGATLVFLTGVITRELGGNKFAQGIAALAVIIAPAFLGISNLMTPNVFSLLFWSLVIYLCIKIYENNQPRHWIVLGIILGIGILNKASIVFLIILLIIGLLIERRYDIFKNKWFYISILIGGLISLPLIIWQIQNDFLSLQFFMDPTRRGGLNVYSVYYLIGQVLYHHPLNFPLLLMGLYFFFFGGGRRYRIFGWVYVIGFSVFFITKAKVYYMSPIYPFIFAGGAVVLGSFINKLNSKWVKPAIITVMILGGIITAPAFLPVFPEDNMRQYINYIRLIGYSNLPEAKYIIKDMRGWETLAERVAEVYYGLTPEKRESCVILADYYPETSALNLFGDKYGLPPVYSRHNNYFLWGKGNINGGQTAIFVGIDTEHVEDIYGDIKLVSTGEHAVKQKIFLCSDPILSLKENWSNLGVYF